MIAETVRSCPHRILFVQGFLIVFVWIGSPSWGNSQEATEFDLPQVASRSREADLAIGAFKLPAGWTVRVFAAEPDVANPVGIHVNRLGHVYVCETFRQSRGVEDNRSHPEWLAEDLAAQTVEDRAAYFQRILGDKVDEYKRQTDRIRRLRDTNGDGRADEVTEFATGFHGLVDGTGASVLEVNGNLLYTCIPHLWRLKDTTSDGIADEREALHSGYGVRVAFRGHDSHGLVQGPDGRVYFSIGDRGYHVVNREGKILSDPASGAVFRCEPDGSQLEVYATGLRNPQDLAFDDDGNLFTGDNNSDSGDRARLVYVVRGGDTGWRMYYQYLPDRGPFNLEKIWHPANPQQPAYILPPITNLADGPSGLAAYPGTGFSPELNGAFLLCDFRGAAPGSGIRSFHVRPHRASFELDRQHELIWGILATDIEFGPDGLYVSDWVHGWNGEGKGRIYCFADPKYATATLAQEVQAWLRRDLPDAPLPELLSAIGHKDRRVRMLVQDELVRRGEIRTLETVVLDSQQTRLARLHALWAIAAFLRTPPSKSQVEVDNPASKLVPLLQDEDAVIRSRAAIVLGELHCLSSVEAMLGCLRDAELPVRRDAALGLADLQDRRAVIPVLDMLRENADQDPVLRHAAVMALVSCATRDSIVALCNHAEPSVRRAAVLVLRRWKDVEIRNFLSDADPSIVTEAARAIYDVPIPEAYSALAQRVQHLESNSDPMLARRILHAIWRDQSNSREALESLFEVAQKNDLPANWRVEALQLIGSWDSSLGIDPFLGDWRPLPQRDTELLRAASQRHLSGLLDSDAALLLPVLKLAQRFGAADHLAALRRITGDASLPPGHRALSLNCLVRLDDNAARETARHWIEDEHAELRQAGLELLVRQQDPKAMSALKRIWAQGEPHERQACLKLVRQLPGADADSFVADILGQLESDSLPLVLLLEAEEAVESRASLQPRWQAYVARRAVQPNSLYRAVLEGGNADRGRELFTERASLSCVRCHQVRGDGGRVGPDLTRIGQEKPRPYLMESIVDPNLAIAQGFDSIVVITHDGRQITGVRRREDEATVTIVTPEGMEQIIPKVDIEERVPGRSAMPDDLAKKITRAELRDLVEYLSSLKD